MINYMTFPGILFETIGFRKEKILEPTENEIVNKIFEIVSINTGVEVLAIKSKGRSKTTRQARQFVHFFIKKYTNLSLRCIGEKTNNDHSSVIHSYKTVINDVKHNRQIAILASKIESKLKEELLIIK